MMDFFVPVLTMTALGLFFSLGLVFAYKKLKVEEDPRVEELTEILPQSNCGACGYSGCQAYAKAVAAGHSPTNLCSVGGDETAQKIADIMGVEAEQVARTVARLHCRGTREAAHSRGVYVGISTCEASHLIGGHKQCAYGCLGYGDCVRSCPFDAITMGEDGLPVVIEEKCTACGNCVEACPRNLLELHPVSQGILVFCRSKDTAPVSRKVCKNACIACGICSRACPEAVVMEDNLAVIKDYKKIPEEKIPAIEKCPTDAIGRIQKENEG